MSLEILTAEHLIYSLWNQVMCQGRGCMIPGLWDKRPDVAMHFQIRIDVENFGYERDGNTHHPEWESRFHRIIHVVVTARHNCHVAVTAREMDVTKVDPKAWVNTSNHDSCWHSDGLRHIWDTLRQGWEHCWSHVPEPHQDSMNSMHKFCQFGDGFATVRPLSFVSIETERDPTCSWRKKITKVSRLGFKIVLDDAPKEAA